MGNETMPRPSSALLPLRDAVMATVFDGAPLSEADRDAAKRVLVDFGAKAMMGLQIGNAEDLRRTIPMLQQGYLLASEWACSAETIAAIKNNFDALTTYMDMLHKHRLEREKMLLEVVKLSTSANKEGIDPAKHLHVHLVAPVGSANFSPNIMESGESRQRVRNFVDTFLQNVGMSTAPVYPDDELTPEELADIDDSPRLLDVKDLPPEHQV